MSASDFSEVRARIETAIADERFLEARQLLAAAERRFPDATSEIAEIRRELTEVERITLAAQVDEMVHEAQREIARASYPAALAALERALLLAPRNADVQQMLAQTEKAARRHRAAVERNRVLIETVARIESQIRDGELVAARRALQEANATFGRDSSLEGLQERLAERQSVADQEQVGIHLEKARAHLVARDWRAALRETREALSLEAGNREALELRRRALGELDQEEGERHRGEAVEATRRDVERLLAAGEVQRAARRVEEAVAIYGQDKRLLEIARRLDAERAEIQARKRRDWAQRRANEAAAHLAEADLLGRKGNYGEALEHLRTARDLVADPAEIDARLATFEAAHERQLAERQRTAEIEAREAEIRHLLDGLFLDEAEALLQRATRDFGDGERFAALQSRLARLREGGRPAARRGTGVPGASSEPAALLHQRELAAAYSWKQTLLFPFRGSGWPVFWGLAGLFLALDVAAWAVPAGSPYFLGVRLLVIVAFLGCELEIVRQTATGGNSLPPWDELARPGRWLRDLLLLLVLLAIAALPLAALLLTRGAHPLLGADAGPWGWLLLALVLWLGGAWLVTAGSAAGVFGARRMASLLRHVKGLGASDHDAVLTIDLVFVLAALALLLRFAVAPLVPWLGLPLACAIEAYSLLAVPHLLGVLVRRHRIELARIYG